MLTYDLGVAQGVEIMGGALLRGLRIPKEKLYTNHRGGTDLTTASYATYYHGQFLGAGASISNPDVLFNSWNDFAKAGFRLIKPEVALAVMQSAPQAANFMMKVLSNSKTQPSGFTVQEVTSVLFASGYCPETGNRIDRCGCGSLTHFYADVFFGIDIEGQKQGLARLNTYGNDYETLLRYAKDYIKKVQNVVNALDNGTYKNTGKKFFRDDWNDRLKKLNVSVRTKSADVARYMG